MPKTKGADSHNYDHFLELMAPFLERGCNLHEACWQCDLPYDAIYAKCKRDEEYHQKIITLQEMPIVMARKVWMGKIQEGDYVASRDYLRAKRKDEFSEKVETDNVNKNVTLTQEELQSMSDDELLQFLK